MCLRISPRIQRRAIMELFWDKRIKPLVLNFSILCDRCHTMWYYLLEVSARYGSSVVDSEYSIGGIIVNLLQVKCPYIQLAGDGDWNTQVVFIPCCVRNRMFCTPCKVFWYDILLITYWPIEQAWYVYVGLSNLIIILCNSPCIYASESNLNLLSVWIIIYLTPMNPQW